MTSFLSSWFFSASETLRNNFALFILNRTVKPFLRRSVLLEQVAADLSQGTASLRDLELREEKLNETLQKFGAECVDAFVGSLTITVPWSALGTDPIPIELNDVQLTLRSSAKSGDCNVPQTEAASFLSSLNSENDESIQEAVTAFASVLESLSFLAELRINSLILRYENDHGSESCNALELRVKRINVSNNASPSSGRSPAQVLHVAVDGVEMFVDSYSKRAVTIADSSNSILSLRRSTLESLRSVESTNPNIETDNDLSCIQIAAIDSLSLECQLKGDETAQAKVHVEIATVRGFLSPRQASTVVDIVFSRPSRTGICLSDSESEDEWFSLRADEVEENGALPSKTPNIVVSVELKDFEIALNTSQETRMQSDKEKAAVYFSEGLAEDFVRLRMSDSLVAVSTVDDFFVHIALPSFILSENIRRVGERSTSSEHIAHLMSTRIEFLKGALKAKTSNVDMHIDASISNRILDAWSDLVINMPLQGESRSIPDDRSTLVFAFEAEKVNASIRLLDDRGNQTEDFIEVALEEFRVSSSSSREYNEFSVEVASESLKVYHRTSDSTDPSDPIAVVERYTGLTIGARISVRNSSDPRQTPSTSEGMYASAADYISESRGTVKMEHVSSRKELEDFATLCMSQSDVVVQVKLPCLKLVLNSQKQWHALEAKLTSTMSAIRTMMLGRKGFGTCRTDDNETSRVLAVHISLQRMILALTTHVKATIEIDAGSTKIFFINKDTVDLFVTSRRVQFSEESSENPRTFVVSPLDNHEYLRVDASTKDAIALAGHLMKNGKIKIALDIRRTEFRIPLDQNSAHPLIRVAEFFTPSSPSESQANLELVLHVDNVVATGLGKDESRLRASIESLYCTINLAETREDSSAFFLLEKAALVLHMSSSMKPKVVFITEVAEAQHSSHPITSQMLTISSVKAHLTPETVADLVRFVGDLSPEFQNAKSRIVRADSSDAGFSIVPEDGSQLTMKESLSTAMDPPTRDKCTAPAIIRQIMLKKVEVKISDDQCGDNVCLQARKVLLRQGGFLNDDESSDQKLLLAFLDSFSVVDSVERSNVKELVLQTFSKKSETILNHTLSLAQRDSDEVCEITCKRGPNPHATLQMAISNSNRALLWLNLAPTTVNLDQHTADFIERLVTSTVRKLSQENDIASSFIEVSISGSVEISGLYPDLTNLPSTSNTGLPDSSSSFDSDSEASSSKLIFSEFRFQPSSVVRVNYTGRGKLDDLNASTIARAFGSLSHLDINLNQVTLLDIHMDAKELHNEVVSEWKKDAIPSVVDLVSALQPIAPVRDVVTGTWNLLVNPARFAKQAVVSAVGYTQQIMEYFNGGNGQEGYFSRFEVYFRPMANAARTGQQLWLNYSGKWKRVTDE